MNDPDPEEQMFRTYLYDKMCDSIYAVSIYSTGKFAKLVGRSIKSLQAWDRTGKLKAHRTPTNRRYYTQEDYLAYTGQKLLPKQIAVYCRVSGRAQKRDLQSQKDAVEQFCTGAGKPIGIKFEDVASGLNYRRKAFLTLLEQVEIGAISEIVVAHKDRLVRFGFEWIEHFCNRHGCKITVINNEKLSPEAEMVQDLLSIVHCFSSRLYGLRKYKQNLAAQIRENAP